MKLVKRFLQYLRINDSKNDLSITNLLVLVMIIKFAFTETESADIAALATVVLNYSYKKWLEAP